MTPRIWVLFDLDNGDPLSKRYLWWFPSREAARKHRKAQMSRDNHARLSQPVLYIKADPWETT